MSPSQIYQSLHKHSVQHSIHNSYATHEADSYTPRHAGSTVPNHGQRGICTTNEPHPTCSPCCSMQGAGMVVVLHEGSRNCTRDACSKPNLVHDPAPSNTLQYSPSSQAHKSQAAANAAAAAILASLPFVTPAALAADFTPPPTTTTVQTADKPQTLEFPSAGAAPAVTSESAGLPEGTQWRYSEFINAVQNGKVERVRFSKDGSQLQLTAVDGRRATVRVDGGWILMGSMSSSRHHIHTTTHHTGGVAQRP